MLPEIFWVSALLCCISTLPFFLCGVQHSFLSCSNLILIIHYIFSLKKSEASLRKKSLQIRGFTWPKESGKIWISHGKDHRAEHKYKNKAHFWCSCWKHKQDQKKVTNWNVINTGFAFLNTVLGNTILILGRGKKGNYTKKAW